jgi:polyphosphate kinase
LEERGVHVIYGLLGIKTHCKLSMLVRRDEDRLRRYVHLGTGNYNHETARFYTDIGLLTARDEMTREVAEVFNLLTARSAETFRTLLVAPTTLMSGMLSRIDAETEHARAGRPAAIVAKMNGLVDPKIIRALYRASMAGVEIDLIVRGICCLRPSLLGISERIRVTSIIGCFLEHSRVFYFANGGTPEIWCSSADWMNRNLRNRVEVAFPIEDETIKARIHHFLQLCLADRAKARICQSDGTYIRLEPADGEVAVSVQQVMMQDARGNASDLQLPPLIGWNETGDAGVPATTAVASVRQA